MYSVLFLKKFLTALLGLKVVYRSMNHPKSVHRTRAVERALLLTADKNGQICLLTGVKPLTALSDCLFIMLHPVLLNDLLSQLGHPKAHLSFSSRPKIAKHEGSSSA